MTSYQPGIYTKGEKTRRAQTPADAVAAAFDGYVLQDAVEPSEDVQPSDTPTPDVASGTPSDLSDPSTSYQS